MASSRFDKNRINRAPAGSPNSSGGQFAAKHHPGDDTVSLDQGDPIASDGANSSGAELDGGVAATPQRTDGQQLDSVNPSGTVFAEYDPLPRATANLAPNLTTYAVTADLDPDTMVTVYRGAPAGTQTDLNPGDYITTNQQIARDYAGTGIVVSQQVLAREIIDDLDEPLGEEYVYRPDDELL